MNKFEEQALGSFLSDYDDTDSFDNILKDLSTENYAKITVWQPFEDYDGNKISELILDMKISLQKTFKE